MDKTKAKVAMIKMAIPLSGLLKKEIARRCNLSPPRLSEMLHGDREIPADVADCLIKMLGIEKTYQRLTAVADPKIELEGMEQ